MGLRIVESFIEYLLYTTPHTRVTFLSFFSARAEWLAGPVPWQWKHGVLTTGPPGNSGVTSLNLPPTDR